MQKQQNELAVNLLKEIYSVNPDTFQEMKVFFNEAFLLLTSSERFNGVSYRETWALYIDVLGTLGEVFEREGTTMAKVQLIRAIKILEGKEQSND